VYIGVDVALFDRLVAEGRMPEPRTIHGSFIWDAEEVARAFRQLPHRAPAADTDATAHNVVKPAEEGPGYANVYTPRTLAKRWKCSPETIYTMIARGDLAAFKVGGKLLRIKAEDVEAFEQRSGDVEGATKEAQPDAPEEAKPKKPRAKPLLSRRDMQQLRARWARGKPTAST
jgi:excisionase family DNA binding protein